VNCALALCSQPTGTSTMSAERDLSQCYVARDAYFKCQGAETRLGVTRRPACLLSLSSRNMASWLARQLQKPLLPMQRRRWVPARRMLFRVPLTKSNAWKSEHHTRPSAQRLGGSTGMTAESEACRFGPSGDVQPARICLARLCTTSYLHMTQLSKCARLQCSYWLWRRTHIASCACGPQACRCVQLPRRWLTAV
jgi:hypothetical protein